MSTSPEIESNIKSGVPLFVSILDLNFLGAYREPNPIPRLESLLSIKIPSSGVILDLFLSNRLIFHFWICALRIAPLPIGITLIEVFFPYPIPPYTIVTDSIEPLLITGFNMAPTPFPSGSRILRSGSEV